MKRRLITSGALALALLTLSASTAFAQYRGRDWNDDKRGQHQNDEWNRSHHSFNDRDRQVTRDWYLRNRNHVGRGWSERDRLSPSMERRLRRGARLDRMFYGRMYWLPYELTRLYGPAPRGYRYAIIGGNIVLLDRDYFVRDVFRIDIRIH
jgi:Ni/Co efflux regulator RcnB